MRDRQIDFPTMQKEDPRVTPFLLVLSLVCIVVVVVIVLTELNGPFIGPWG